MLYNVSYTNPEITQKINEELGKPFSFKERIQKNGIGSPKLIILSRSIQIHNLLILDNNRDVCNIELRPEGILIGFRSLLESYALPIPYYKLVVYKGKSDSYTLYRDTYFIEIEARPKDHRVHAFMQRILKEKAQRHSPPLEEM